MAAVGVLVALRERERSGEGQLVDCSMFDGALSWLALVAADVFATGAVPRAGELQLAGALTCYRPYECADGYVTLGALEPKFWQAFCRGVGREDLLEHAFDPPGSRRTRSRRRDLRRSARASSGAQFASEHDCCLEPVLDLDEVARVRARRGAGDGRRARAAGGGAAGQAARRAVKLSRTPADPTRARVPGSASTPTRCSRPPAIAPRRSRRCTSPARSPGPRQACRARSCAHEHRSQRHAEDVRARRALGRQRRDDQALPARGAARRRGRGRAHAAATWPTTRPSSSSGSG